MKRLQRAKLTKPTIDGLRVERKDAVFWDRNLTGFGVRVYPAALIGSQSHASEVLNRQRPLTLPMIRVLSAEWDLPADILVREYDLATTA